MPYKGQIRFNWKKNLVGHSATMKSIVKSHLDSAENSCLFSFDQPTSP